MASLDYGLWNLVAVEVVAPDGWRELEDLRLNGRDVNSLFPCRLPDGYESVIRVLPVEAVEYFVTEVAYTLGRVPLERLMDARRVSEFTVRQVMGAARDRDEADLMGSRTKSSASRPDVEILSPLGLGSRVFVLLLGIVLLIILRRFVRLLCLLRLIVWRFRVMVLS